MHLLSAFRATRDPTIGATLPAWLERTQLVTLLTTALLFSAGYATIGLFFILVGVIAEGMATGRIPWQRGRIDFILFAFIVVFFISGLLSPYRLTAVGSTVLAALTIYFAYGPLYRSLRRDRNFLKTFLWVWVIGGVVSAMWAISIYRVTKLPASTPAIGPNAVGTTLQVAIFLSVGLFLTSTTVWKYLLILGAPILALGLILTYSRGAWIGGILALGIFFLLVELRHSWRALLLLIFIGVLSAVFIGSARSAIIEWGSKIFSLEVNRDRVAIAESALAIFRDHPVIGTGMNTFASVYPRYRLPEGPDSKTMPFAHNIFLNMAAEGGALGLAAFAAIIGWGTVTGWQWYTTSLSPPETILSASILSAFTGMLVQQLFDGTILSVHLGAGLWFLIAILAAFNPKDTGSRPTRATVL